MKTHRFTLHCPGEHGVCIAGSFNHWSPDATPLQNVGDGSWAVEVPLPPGRYEYRFVIDGEWVDDPNAVEVTPSPFGGVNAVLVISEEANVQSAPDEGAE